ncbi:hypothetical protein JOQ06_005731 [Pogonophryne albipinna]|uniref:Reelin domain-containing protein n=1 Tax=Pogonophryne albipinna TaxID=1090488 RepID=A0AAD6FQJ8_9TELE|nr:hypothetical protein JOQ06_005731 [Pogonophryne albipinna]
MWLWILISLEIITKVQGYSNGRFQESCDSMLPVHTNINEISYEPQSADPPFEITYDPAPHGQPITVYLKSKQSNKFTGFMLEARKTEDVVGPAVGKFIVLDSRETRLLSCHSSPPQDNAVSQRFSSEKSLFKVNWTAPAQEENLDYTFSSNYYKYYNANYNNSNYYNANYNSSNYYKYYNANYNNSNYYNANYNSSNYYKYYNANYNNSNYYNAN